MKAIKVQMIASSVFPLFSKDTLEPVPFIRSQSVRYRLRRLAPQILADQMGGALCKTAFLARPICYVRTTDFYRTPLGRLAWVIPKVVS
jgi:hypothetical protein